MKGFQKYPLITHPFGIDDVNRPDFPLTYDPTKINYSLGIPPACGVIGRMGGTRCDRHMMNQLAYLSTVGGFLTQVGDPQTFNADVAEAIGGYAKGTVLRDLSRAYDNDNAEGEFSVVRDVVSLQDNNKMNFVYDAVKNPNPYVIGSEVDGKVWWKYVYDEVEHSTTNLGRPDITNMTLEYESVYSEVGRYEYTYTAASDRWLFISTIPENGYEDSWCLHRCNGNMLCRAEVTSGRDFLSQERTSPTISLKPYGSSVPTTFTASNKDWFWFQDEEEVASPAYTRYRNRYVFWDEDKGKWYEFVFGNCGERGVYITQAGKTFPSAESKELSGTANYYQAHFGNEIYYTIDGLASDIKEALKPKYEVSETNSGRFGVINMGRDVIGSFIIPVEAGNKITFTINVVNTDHSFIFRVFKMGTF